MAIQLSEQTLSGRLPYPIASAWHRVALGEDDRDKIQRLIECNEIFLRTLSAILLPDYLRGPRSEVVEAAIRNMAKDPTDGKWAGLVRNLIQYLGQRTDPPPFIPEATSWYFTPDGGKTEAAQAVDDAITLRNRVIHKGRNPAINRQNLAKLHEKVRSALLSMRWLVAYPLFRVFKINRVGGGLITGSIQLLVGKYEKPAPVAAEWHAHLDKDFVHLSNPAATALLDLRPFLEILPDPITEQPKLYLIKEMPGLKRIQVIHDESGSEISRLLEDRGQEISFEEWLDRRASYDFFRPLDKSIKALIAWDEEPAKETDLGPRYEKLSELGRGGMSIVYRVRDRKWDKEAALKVLNNEEFEDATSRQRFLREARTMHNIQHVSIVHVDEIDELPDGRLYLKMPVMANGNLESQITPHVGRSEKDVLRWAANALEALACVHAHNIIHRDVKPSNFLLADDGRAMLSDFGIALNPNDDRLTRTLDTIGGTIQYMAPEQRTLRTVTDKADIYSLAVVLHELRMGELPEDRPGMGIDNELGKLIRSMGENDPRKRPSATDALQKLQATPQSDAASIVTPVVTRVRKKRTSTASRKRHREEEERRRHDELAKIQRQEEEQQLALQLAERRQAEQRRASLKVKLWAAAILVGLFTINFLETSIETALRDSPQHIGVQSERFLGEAAMHWEPELSFDQYDASDNVARVGYSIVYFIVFPLLGIGAMFVFISRPDPKAFLLLATATAVDYAISLPFFILFPVPERWAHQESGAILLSDLWKSELIDAFRPFSGVNNCFPSFHVSVTVIILVCLYTARTPFRSALIPVGLAVVLSTFALGVHWISDILAGIAVGIVSVWLAEGILRRRRSMPLVLKPKPANS